MPSPRRPHHQRQETPGVDEDQDLLQEELADVEPLETNRASRVPRPRPKSNEPRPPDQEARHRLQVERYGERIEASSPDVDGRMLRDLRAARSPAEARLDLHGRSRADAVRALEGFVIECRRAGRRVALVVIGRGSRSQDGRSPIREAIPDWLADHPNHILAFCSAPPHEGGTGALRIRLRR